jgi:hypothetical protein
VRRIFASALTQFCYAAGFSPFVDEFAGRIGDVRHNRAPFRRLEDRNALAEKMEVRMFSSSRPEAWPCPSFPAAVLFPDVEPEVLAMEAANEARRASRPDHWNTYLHRVLPALETSAADEMAQALLTAGTGLEGARLHVERMRRQSIATGAVHRARFWADVSEVLARIVRS